MRSPLIAIAPALVVLSLAAPSATAQTRTTAGDLQCMPWERHSVVTARVTGAPEGSTVRLYFRRLHEEVEDFYWVQMTPRGGGEYWAALPKPANERLPDKELEDPETDEQEDNPEAAWWMAKERSTDRDPNDDLNQEIIEERASQGRQVERDWLRAMSLAELERWLDGLPNEAAEYFAVVFGVDGREIAGSRSAVKVVRITEPDDCNAPSVVVPVDYGRVVDDPDPSPELVRRAREWGAAGNLVVGETDQWQIGRRVFHWLCDGVVSRSDYRGILREDDVCRACAVGFIRNPARFLPAVAGVVILRPPVSPTEP